MEGVWSRKDFWHGIWGGFVWVEETRLPSVLKDTEGSEVDRMESSGLKPEPAGRGLEFRVPAKAKPRVP